jgi:hypothetical protein
MGSLEEQLMAFHSPPAVFPFSISQPVSLKQPLFCPAPKSIQIGLPAELKNCRILIMAHHRIPSPFIPKVTKLILEWRHQMVLHLSFFELGGLIGINQLFPIIILQHLDWKKPSTQWLVARPTPSPFTGGKAPTPAQGVCAKDAIDGPQILAALLPQADPAKILQTRSHALAT